MEFPPWNDQLARCIGLGRFIYSRFFPISILWTNNYSFIAQYAHANPEQKCVSAGDGTNLFDTFISVSFVFCNCYFYVSELLLIVRLVGVSQQSLSYRSNQFVLNASETFAFRIKHVCVCVAENNTHDYVFSHDVKMMKWYPDHAFRDDSFGETRQLSARKYVSIHHRIASDGQRHCAVLIDVILLRTIESCFHYFCSDHNSMIIHFLHFFVPGLP